MESVKYLKLDGVSVRPFSQAGQDVFAWEVNSHKRNGTFVDIGCNDPFVHSNTAALEQFGWTGVCVDVLPFDYSKRKARFVQADATQLIPILENFIKLHKGEIDYLSLDADDATFGAMERLIPFYKFKAITVEHDSYRVGPKIKNEIYDFLRAFGYTRQHEDVLAPESPGMPWSKQPFEDWYSRS